MLSVTNKLLMLSVIILSVVAPHKRVLPLLLWPRFWLMMSPCSIQGAFRTPVA
jgi:hypothetical protein